MTNDDRDLLTNSLAARTLHEVFPDKTPEQWTLWLQNNRNQARSVPYRIPFERMHGGVFYEVAQLNRFADYEKSRQLGTIKLTGRAAEAMQAFGIGEAGGGTYGRKLAYSVQLGFEEDDSSRQFVRLMIERPLGVFRLEAEEAEALAAELLDVANAIRRHDAEETNNSPKVTIQTMRDNVTETMIKTKAPK